MACTESHQLLGKSIHCPNDNGPPSLMIRSGMVVRAAEGSSLKIIHLYDPLLLLALGQSLYLLPLSPQFLCRHRTIFQRKRGRLLWQKGSWPNVPTPPRSLMFFSFSEVYCWPDNASKGQHPDFPGPNRINSV